MIHFLNSNRHFYP